MASNNTRKKKITDLDWENACFWASHGIDFINRKIELDEDVDQHSVGWIIRAIEHMDQVDSSRPIDVFIRTYGGDCYDGLALYDAMRECECEIHTRARGKVMSMGTFLMLGGDKKYASKNTTFMWHSVSSGADGKLFDLETEAEEVKRLWEQMLTIYGKRSNKPKNFWKRWIRYEDKYGDVDKAVELGFVDEVVGHKDD